DVTPDLVPPVPEVGPGEDSPIGTRLPAEPVTDVVDVFVPWAVCPTVAPLEPDEVADDRITRWTLQFSCQMRMLCHLFRTFLELPLRHSAGDSRPRYGAYGPWTRGSRISTLAHRILPMLGSLSTCARSLAAFSETTGKCITSAVSSRIMSLLSKFADAMAPR